MSNSHVSNATKIKRLILAVAVLIGTVAAALALPSATAGAEGSHGAGLPVNPPQGSGFNGAYLMPFGIGYCINPGAAAPVDAPNGTYSPVALPGGSGYTAGEMGALMYFSTIYYNGYNGYDSNTTNAVIGSISKDYGGGDNLPGVTNQTEKAQIVAYIHAFPGPWSINFSVPPADGPGGTYKTHTNYSGNVQILAANGNPVGGLALNVAKGGQITNFVWNNGTVTDAIGNLGFTFNMDNAGTFSALVAIQGGAPAAVPGAYGAPAGSGYQALMMSGAANPFNGFSGTSAVVNAPATLNITKSSTVPAYLGNSLGGAVFQVINSSQQVVAQATTDATGHAGPMQVPSVQTYTIHESVAPPGMTAAPDQQWSPASGDTALYNFTDPVTPVHLTINKLDSDTQTGLAGAQFTVFYDSANTGTYNQPITGPNPDGSFTTGADGVAIDPQNVLKNLMPGNYQVTETVAPPNHVLPSPTFINANIPVSSSTSVTFTDVTQPTMTTTPQTNGVIGGPLTDSATISNASAKAGGTVTFSAYGPFSSQAAVTCTKQVLTGPANAPNVTLAFTSAPVTVNGSGTYAMTDSFKPTAAGLYQWVASYSGDANNVPVTGNCPDTTEQSVVVALSTSATPAVGTTEKISDTATVNAPYLPVGGANVTFVAYGPYATPAAATCDVKDKVFTSVPVAVTANQTPQTYAMADSYAPQANGIYEWVETLSDSQQATIASGSCGKANEQSVVVGLTTNATATASTDVTSPLGNVIADNATTTGPVPSGSKLTFTAYGPYTDATTATCATADLVFTSATQTLTGPGTVTSDQYTVTKAGTYEWIATLTDAAGNVITAGTCGATNEQSSVTTPAPVQPAPTPGQVAPAVPVTG
jgi:hypothetical protein